MRGFVLALAASIALAARRSTPGSRSISISSPASATKGPPLADHGHRRPPERRHRRPGDRLARHDEANEWARTWFEEHGLQNAHLEPYDFGRGWSWSRCALDLLGAHPTSCTPCLRAGLPEPRSRGRCCVPARSRNCRGSRAVRRAARRKFVLISDERPVEPLTQPAFRRYADEDLEKESAFEMPEMEEGESEWVRDFRKRLHFRAPSMRS